MTMIEQRIQQSGGSFKVRMSPSASTDTEEMAPNVIRSQSMSEEESQECPVLFSTLRSRGISSLRRNVTWMAIVILVYSVLLFPPSFLQYRKNPDEFTSEGVKRREHVNVGLLFRSTLYRSFQMPLKVIEKALNE